MYFNPDLKLAECPLTVFDLSQRFVNRMLPPSFTVSNLAKTNLETFPVYKGEDSAT